MAMELIGFQDKNLKLMEELFGCSIVYRDSSFIMMEADDQQKAVLEKLIGALIHCLEKKIRISQRDIIYAYRRIMQGKEVHLDTLMMRVIGKTISGKPIAPKTMGQMEFVKAMEKKDIVFAIGPAGTGKTYLAVVYAVELLKKGIIKKIVLTRPAVEAGENLGFLPGDLKEKVDPYLIPLYDALYELLSKETCEKYMEKGTIEIAPLAYMRGRTLEDAFVILDEAQNTTPMQMKMFLTRLGFNSKMVITGDITQVDLIRGKRSGLLDVQKILSGIQEIAFCLLSSDDVIRHPLVQKIIERYEEME
ncbi:MAG: PhoH family protein [Erysipelotrichaceae bacterium]|nr:PhoH family protein [Erysipelotrichaceae bacterium]MBQ4342880.1 PhoH family protein [Erysipelotrichaceae bacterium]